MFANPNPGNYLSPLIEIFPYSFSLFDLLLLLSVAMLVGMSKTGVHGSGMISIPLLAIIFGSKASTGILLPILIFADLFGVYYFHKHADWSHLKRLLPFALVGVIIGTLTGNFIDDQLFSLIMLVIIVASLVIMIWQAKNSNSEIPQSNQLSAATGIAGGFATMIGNLAGPVMSLYLLMMRLPKDQFIGTAAWFFLIVNVSKVPLHIWAWGTITVDTFVLDIVLIPAIALGAFLGVRIVRRIPEKLYRWFVIVMTAAAAVAMFFKSSL